MSYSVRYECGGRLGNCVFPYILCILYQKMYGHRYVTEQQANEVVIDDALFLKLFPFSNDGQIQLPHLQANLVFRGYFQHDQYLKYCKSFLEEWIREHPDQEIITGWNERIPAKILIEDALPDVHLSPKTLVIHLRMEDKVADVIEPNSALFVIHPDDYAPVLEKLDYDTILWVMNKPTQAIEFQYLSYLQTKYGGTYKVQRLEEDMSLMRKAPILLCSRSSLSWICSAFAYGPQKVVMPERYETWIHETFMSVQPDTQYFSYRKASRKDLEQLFANLKSTQS